MGPPPARTDTNGVNPASLNPPTFDDMNRPCRVVLSVHYLCLVSVGGTTKEDPSVTRTLRYGVCTNERQRNLNGVDVLVCIVDKDIVGCLFSSSPEVIYKIEF